MAATSSPSAADFSCSICFDTASEPVVTRCGHLFCWGCLDQWLRRPEAVPECPVCKGRVDEHVDGDIIPLYGKGARARPHEPHDTGATAASTQTQPYDETTARARQHSAAAAATTAATARRSQPSAAERPRPAAARAPTPPREQANMFGHVGRRGAVPLQMGGFFFVCGGGLSMTLMSLLLFLWGMYRFAPWQRWLEHAQRRLRARLRRRTNNNNNNNSGEEAAAARGDDARRPPGAAAAETAAAVTHDAPVADPEALLRNVCIGFFVACFLYILLLAQ